MAPVLVFRGHSALGCRYTEDRQACCVSGRQYTQDHAVDEMVIQWQHPGIWVSDAKSKQQHHQSCSENEKTQTTVFAGVSEPIYTSTAECSQPPIHLPRNGEEPPARTHAHCTFRSSRSCRMLSLRSSLVSDGSSTAPRETTDPPAAAATATAAGKL